MSTALSVVDERVQALDTLINHAQTGTMEPELTVPRPKPKSEHARANPSKFMQFKMSCGVGHEIQ